MKPTHSLGEAQRRKARIILVVEDDPSVGTLLGETLKLERRYQVLLVTDGIQALQVMDSAVPDLIVLDYRLPSMNGLELADHLQARDALKAVPMLLMSASMPERERKQLRITFIEKPFELETFLHTIEGLLAS